MKRFKSNKTSLIFLLIALGVLLGLILCIAVCFATSFGIIPGRPKEDYWALVNDRVKIGDDRDQAIQALSDEAWYHGTCRYGNDMIDDLFVFGPQGPRGTVIGISSLKEDDKFVVSSMGVVGESLRGTFAGCLPPEVMP